MADLAIDYRAEIHFGQQFSIEIALDEFSKKTAICPTEYPEKNQACFIFAHRLHAGHCQCNSFA